MAANQVPAAPKVVRAEFVASAVSPSQWPEADVDEIAFVGRSNVGKSSLLNALVDRRGLARTSQTPGVTRLTNFFVVELVDGERRRTLRLVDLPGFGYAKVSKAERATWRPAIERYLGGRSSLRAAVVLIDARRIPVDGGEKGRGAAEEPLLEERDLAAWIGARGVSVIPVVTKVDKLSKHERRPAAERLRGSLGSPPVLFSAVTGEGRDHLWSRLLSALPPVDAPV